jgi:hypothetical protein
MIFRILECGYSCIACFLRSCYSSLSILARLQVGQPGFSFQHVRERIYLFATASKLVLGPTHLPIGWILGALSLEVKLGWGMKLTTHLHPVPKNAWSYLSIPPYVFMTGYLVKHRIHLHGMVLS